MKLPDFCIRRPVFTIVMMLIMVIVGAVSYFHLAVRQFPQVEKAVITVRTGYEGASPEIIETQITRPLEGALAGLEGLDFMSSTSEEGMSRISLNFLPERSMDAAAADVRDKLGRVQDRLPREAERPVILKTDADAETLISLAMTSETRPPADMFDYADKRLKGELEAVSGVAEAEVYGSAKYVMHVWLDPVKLAAHQLTVQDIIEALANQNVEIPGGRLSNQDREFQVTTSASMSSREEFENLIVNRSQGYLVKLKDVGHAEFAPGEEKSYVSLNGKPAIGIEIKKKSTANPLDLARDLKKLLPRIQETLPTGMKIDIAYDKTGYIQSSIDQVYRGILEATLLVSAVVFLTLWSWRAAIIPLVTLPVCLVATFALMYWLGFSVNTLTLLGMVLAIGLVVDDAIVMMENIFRHIEEGQSPMKAALVGSKEIAFAIIAMTLTLAAVYAPIALAQGMIGKIFTEFALTLAGAVLLSGFVALTLSPMMCARLLRPHVPGHRTPNEVVLGWLDRGYEEFLKKALSWRVFLIGLGVLVGLVGVFLSTNVLKKELLPPDDQGLIMGKAEAPANATLNFTIPYVLQMEQILREIPEIEKQYTVVDREMVFSYNTLKPWNKRKRTAAQIQQEVMPKLQAITGIHARATLGKTLLSGGGQNASAFQFVLQSTRSYKDLIEMLGNVARLLRRHGGFGMIQEDTLPDNVEYTVDIDRAKAGLLEIEEDIIGKTVEDLVSGANKTKVRREGEEYDVKVQLLGQARSVPQDLDGIYMKVKRGDKVEMVPLSTVADVKLRSVPSVINHFNQMRSATLFSDLAKGFSLGEAVEFVRNLKYKILPDEFRTDFSGETRNFLKSQDTLMLIFVLALVFIYLVMAGQFESFVDPFIIMFSVPLSLTGALLFLWMTGGTLNVYSEIGLVTLIGLITKHGILIVEFANGIAHKRGWAEAVIEASKLRLRPILMTTGAMVLGALPLALARGAGASGRQQIGWVIVGGMLLGTILTLFLIPALYVATRNLQERLGFRVRLKDETIED